MTDFIPPAKPIIGDEERAAVDRVMRSGMIAQNPEVAALEQEFSSHFGLGRACLAVTGEPVGAFGDFSMFSLYPTKNMTSGENGMVSVANADQLTALGFTPQALGGPVDAVVLHTDHAEYRQLRQQDISDVGVLFDGPHRSNQNNLPETTVAMIGQAR